jgi:hypothetical protein
MTQSPRSELVRITLGILAASATAFVLLPVLLYLMLSQDGGTNEGMTSLAEGATAMVAMYSFIIVPVIVLVCGAVFTLVYVILRLLHARSRVVFAVMGSALALFVLFLDSNTSEALTSDDVLLIAAVAVYGAIVGAVFGWVAVREK